MNFTCPAESLVAFVWYAMAPLEISWSVTLAPGAGAVAFVPSVVWSAVTVIDCPGLIMPGIVACWETSTGARPSCGDIRLPHLKAGFLVSMAKAGDVEAEYLVRMNGPLPMIPVPYLPMKVTAAV